MCPNYYFFAASFSVISAYSLVPSFYGAARTAGIHWLFFFSFDLVNGGCFLDAWMAARGAGGGWEIATATECTKTAHTRPPCPY